MLRKPSMYVAVYLILIKSGKTLLLRRYRTGWQDGKYSLVAGHVEDGEKLTEALCREAREEAGILVRPEDLTFVNVMQRFCAPGRVYLDFFFLARRWKGNVQNLEPGKCDELRWVPLKRLPRRTLPYIRRVLAALLPKRVGFCEHLRET